MLITETTLRLLNCSEAVIEIMNRQDALPLPKELVKHYDMPEIKLMAGVFAGAEFDEDNRIIKYSMGAEESKVDYTVDYQESVIVVTAHFQYGVKLLATHRPDGRVLRESIIDSKGVKTVRGEFNYHPTHTNSLVSVVKFPTEENLVNEGTEEEPNYQYIVKLMDAEEAEKYAGGQTNVLDEDGRIIRTGDADGVTRYEYDTGDSVRPNRIIKQLVGAMTDDALERITEFKYDEAGFIIHNCVYIHNPASGKSENPIMEMSYRNEYEGDRLIKAFEVQNGSESCFINLEKFWEEFDAIKAKEAA